MRRKDREMPTQFALEVADKCRYAVLSVIAQDQTPYGVPLSIARDGDAVYFHSAKEGYKIDCLRNNSAVCLTCVGDVRPVEDQFTVEYESATLRGTARVVTDKEEKLAALKLLCLRHAPSNMANFEAELALYFDRTAVWRIDITRATGKRLSVTPRATN